MKSLVILGAGLLIAAPLSGCSILSSPSCGDFVDATSSEQTEMATKWIEDNSDELGEGTVTTQFTWDKMSSGEQVSYVESTLSQYCANDPEAMLSELGPGATFGF